MAFKDLTFRLFGEDVSASDSIKSVTEMSEKLVRKVPAGFATARSVVTGVGLAAAGAAVGIGAAALQGAAAAEQSNLKVAGSLGLTAKQAERFGKLAGQVYSDNYGESLEQVQDTVANVATGIQGMSRASNSAVSSMTGKVLSFSSAFEMDASESIQQVNQLIASKLAKDGPAAMDLLTAAMQRVPKAVRGDLLDAVNEYSPFMHQLGLSGAQSMQLLVDSTGKGQFGLDKTGDALKEFTIRSTDMSKSSVSAYKTLGLNAHTMADDILKGGKHASGALDDIVGRLLKIDDPAKRSNTAIALFGTQMEDLGVGEVPKFLRSLQGVGKGMEGTKGAAEKLAATTGGGAANGVATLSRKWDMVTQSLVAGALPILTTVFGFLAQNEGLMKVIAVGIGIAALAFGALTVAMWAASLTPVALMFAGIVVAVGLLIAGIVLLVQNWDKVVAWFQGVWAGVCTWFSDTLASIGTWWSDTWNGLLGFLKQWGPLLLAVIAPVIGIPLLIIQHWGEIVAWFSKLPGVVGGLLAGAAKWLVETGRDILSGLLEGAKHGLTAAGTWAAGIGAKVTGWLAAAGTWLVETGRDLLDGLIDGAKKGLLALGKWELTIGAKVIGWLSDAGQWLLDTGSDILHGLASGAKTGWSAVTKFLGGIPDKTVAAIGKATAILLGVGRDIIAGLLAGLRGSADKVMTWIGGFIGDVVAFAKKLLGIASPSKVFKQIGAWLGEGFRDGIAGTRDQVLSAMQDLVSKVKDIPDKAFRKAGTTKSAIVKSLEDDTKALARLAQRRDTLAEQLKTAQDKLDQAVDTRNSYRDTVSGGAAALGLATAAKGVSGEDGTTAAVTAADILKTKQSALEGTNRFRSQLSQLQQMGLNADDYKAVVDAFQQSGDTSIADALLAGGKGAVDELNELNERLNTAAGQLGDRTSNRLYQAGVDSARELAKGLEDQIAAVTGAMGVVQQGIAVTLSKLGIDTSELSKQAGRDIADGVAVGLKEKRSALDGVFDDLAAGWVKTIKKKLKIKSPSGVFRDEVGSMIPAGVAEGIRGGVSDIDRELAAMVNTPTYAGVGAPAAASNTPARAAAGNQPLVHIDNFHATPEQSPAEIAADLGWLARGGL